MKSIFLEVVAEVDKLYPKTPERLQKIIARVKMPLPYELFMVTEWDYDDEEGWKSDVREVILWKGLLILIVVFGGSERGGEDSCRADDGGCGGTASQSCTSTPIRSVDHSLTSFMISIDSIRIWRMPQNRRMNA